VQSSGIINRIKDEIVMGAGGELPTNRTAGSPLHVMKFELCVKLVRMVTGTPGASRTELTLIDMAPMRVALVT
jgi:hypothetical protein